MQATFKLSDMLAIGAAVLAMGGILFQVQDHGGRITKLEGKAEAAEVRLGKIDTNIQFLVDAEKRRSEGK